MLETRLAIDCSSVILIIVLRIKRSQILTSWPGVKVDQATGSTPHQCKLAIEEDV
jgi:hypothetical protein